MDTVNVFLPIHCHHTVLKSDHLTVFQCVYITVCIYYPHDLHVYYTRLHSRATTLSFLLTQHARGIWRPRAQLWTYQTVSSAIVAVSSLQVTSSQLAFWTLQRFIGSVSSSFLQDPLCHFTGNNSLCAFWHRLTGPLSGSTHSQIPISVFWLQG